MENCSSIAFSSTAFSISFTSSSEVISVTESCASAGRASADPFTLTVAFPTCTDHSFFEGISMSGVSDTSSVIVFSVDTSSVVVSSVVVSSVVVSSVASSAAGSVTTSAWLWLSVFCASSATGSVTTSVWLWLSVFCGSSAKADVALLSTSTMQSMNAIKRFFVLLFMASSFYSSILTS